MRRRDWIIGTFMFLLCVAGTSEVVVHQLTGRNLVGGTDQPRRDRLAVDKPVTCTKQPAHPRPATDDPQLKVLPEYEGVCGSTVAGSMMLFTGMPNSPVNANKLADAMAVRLKKFDQQKVQPIVVVEPDAEWGLVDFHEFAQGLYDPFIDAYFKRLKRDGVTEAQMGVWLPFPEPQQPYWNNNANPDDFAYSVNRYFHLLRAVYPKAQTAILLDSQAGSGNEASQLVAYTRLVEPGLVDIVGVQGFPWYPKDAGDKRVPLTSAGQFLPANLVDEVAKSLGSKQLLLNTGTYRHRKLDNGGDVAISTEEREDSLESIVTEVKHLKQSGYSITVNVFAENKLDVKEGIDWSYWQPGHSGDSVSAEMFKHFVSELTGQGARISLYDSRK